ncbi:MAG: rRNA maturation RNase YbeY [Coriobacteriia bacterium]|nr:rRNA maturation RNase YbeY [Coriobacteriia bacterium]
MIITVDNRSGEELPVDEYQALAAFVLQQEQVNDDVELSISLVGHAEMHALNKKYRGIDRPTDVLAFENDDELLGDVIVCPSVARQHAEEFTTGFPDEMALMLTHGILHLRGYDHLDDAEATIMEQRENELLNQWRSQ